MREEGGAVAQQLGVSEGVRMSNSILTGLSTNLLFIVPPHRNVQRYLCQQFLTL